MPAENSMTVTSEGETLQARTLNCNYPVRLPPPDDEGEGEECAYREIAKELTLPRSLHGVISFSAKSTAETQQLITEKSQTWLVVSASLFYVGFFGQLMGKGSGLHETQELCDRVSKPLLLLSLVVLLYDQRNLAPWNKRRYLEALSPLLKCGVISKKDKLRVFDRKASRVLDYQIVGSAGDCVGYFSSQGVNNSLITQYSTMTQDADVNILVNSVALNPNNIYSQGLPSGYTRLTFTEEEVEELDDPIIRAHMEWRDGRLLLNAKTFVKETIGIFKQVIDKSRGEFIEENLPAFTWHTWQYGPNGEQHFEVDYAFAFNYFHWPELAEEWVGRERYGLDQKTVNNISRRGCYIVPRQSGENMDVIDWRFTFTAAEADLFQYHRDKEALVLAYIILKHVLKMRGRECSAVRSYHLKTIFFWMAEEDTRLDYYTTKGNLTLHDVFMEMLNRYIKYLEERKLPNYFIPGRNMLQKYVNMEPCTCTGSFWKRKFTVLGHEDCRACEYDFGLRLLKKVKTDPSMSLRGEFEVRFWRIQYLDTVIVLFMFSICIFFAFFYIEQYGRLRPAPPSPSPCDMCAIKAYGICNERWKEYLMYGGDWPGDECVSITAVFVAMIVMVVAFLAVVLFCLWAGLSICLSPFYPSKWQGMVKPKNPVVGQDGGDAGRQ